MENDNQLPEPARRTPNNEAGVYYIFPLGLMSGIIITEEKLKRVAESERQHQEKRDKNKKPPKPPRRPNARIGLALGGI